MPVTSMRLRIVALTLLSFALGGMAAMALFPGGRERLFSGLPSTGKALVGGPFSLVDQTGRRVTDKDFRGRYMLVYFGFTYCPDVCPSGLQVISAALQKLGPKADRIVPILITVDPERDTPAQLAEYVKSFDPRLIGLTGTPQEIDAVAKAYRVYYKKVPDEKSTAGFTIDHSAIIYLMGPDGSYVTHFSQTMGVDALAERLAKVL
jgi:cytochrome oxidase Cu insertion factor (SCO1/SenC/PrrC family)